MKELKIEIPKGYEIDKDKSTFEKIVFKEIEKHKLTYSDISYKLFSQGVSFYINDRGKVEEQIYVGNTYIDSNNSISKEQLESILALNKLCNVAKYLNDEWLPNFTATDIKWSIEIGGDRELRTCKSDGGTMVLKSLVYFKSAELAQQAISILGEEQIRMALTLNH